MESIGGAPPWGSGANRPPPEDYGPVKGLLLYLNYRKSVADCAPGQLPRATTLPSRPLFGGANAAQVCHNVFLVAFYGQCECSLARSARHK